MDVQTLNKILLDRYGRDLYNNPKYRVVFADSQTEKRFGTFTDYTESGLYVRTVTEVREVEKYPFDYGKWVFETIQEAVANPELMAKLSYEPLWIFKDPKTGEALQPELWACEAIVSAHQSVNKLKLSPSDFQAKENLRMAREKMLMKDIIQNESPYIPGAVHAGSGVFVPPNYEKSKE